MTGREARTSAEWVSFASACLILLALVAMIGVQLRDERTPAAPEVRIVAPPRSVGSLHHVDVELENLGDATASNVQVSAELVIDGQVTSADQTIDFLAGHATEHLVFVFDDDPAGGELDVAVTGFAIP